jgi:hypothetical protein
MYKRILFAALIFAGCSKDNDGGGDKGWGRQPDLIPIDGNATFTVGAEEPYVNVMGNAKPATPNFPPLDVKKGFLRGYVADMKGQPLQGAYIGVRSTIGTTNGAHAISDTKGYYEIALPYGAITYYATAYEKDYGQGKVVMGLYPSDDNTAGFASESGQVKNFVLQSYGLGKKSEVSAQPGNATNYYGGAISFDYNIDWDGNMPTYLPKNGMIEITLVPDGPGLFGETRTFIVRKTIGMAGLAILNIPVGKYAISAKLVGGTALNMEEVGPYAGSYPLWGLKPAGPTANATIMFTPNFQYTVQMAVAHKSNWQSVKVNLSR